jgi:hypothetical protein
MEYLVNQLKIVSLTYIIINRLKFLILPYILSYIYKNVSQLLIHYVCYSDTKLYFLLYFIECVRLLLQLQQQQQQKKNY